MANKAVPVAKLVSLPELEEQIDNYVDRNHGTININVATVRALIAELKSFCEIEDQDFPLVPEP